MCREPKELWDDYPARGFKALYQGTTLDLRENTR
jgi:hypothetical protein